MLGDSITIIKRGNQLVQGSRRDDVTQHTRVAHPKPLVSEAPTTFATQE